MRRLAITLGLLSCVGCHNALEVPGAPSVAESQGTQGPTATALPPDHSPGGSAPATIGPGLLTFVSGESQLPVEGARVVIEGHSYVTNSQGEVALDRTAAALSVEASGFLDRKAFTGTDRFTLWPRTSPIGIDEEYTARLVYNCAAPVCADGGEPLGRVLQGVVSLQPSKALLADREAAAAIADAAALWTAATGGQVVFVVGQQGGTTVEVDVDPADTAILSRGAAGVTRRQYSGAAIMHARITLRSIELARRLPLSIHEMGHAFGLAHSPRIGDVMWSGPELYDVKDLSDREKLAVTLMLQRSSGNRFPDSEDGISTVRGASSRRMSVVTCFAE